MAKYKLNIGLSTEELNHAIDVLENYRNVTLPSKLEKFIEKLAEQGITVAQEKINRYNYTDNEGNFTSAILLKKDIYPSIDNCKCIIAMSDKLTISKSWLYFGKVKTEQISPSLMAEFGSGQYAENGMQGSFPRSDGKQSLGVDPPWHWQDLSGSWHTSYGTKPTRPMFNAMQEMINTANQIAREVFANE